MVYMLGGLFDAWSLLTGHAITLTQSPFVSAPAVHVLLGRVLTAVLATASVGVLYLVARRLIGTRAALLAAAAFGLSPLHVLESHRVNPDGTMILLALLAAHQALIAQERQSRIRLCTAFAIGGLAGATKYTGVAAAVLPAWIVLAWHSISRRGRLGLLCAGGMSALAGFAFGMLPVAFEPERFVNAMHLLVAGARLGMPGTDLVGQGWVYVRYLYALLVALPYMMGWPVYVAGMAGLAMLARRNRRVFGIVAAGAGPWFLVQGGSWVEVARYFQPLAPYLALTAGFALEQVWLRRRHLGVTMAGVVLAYTALLTASQLLRLGLGPQEAVAAFVAARVRAASRQPVTVGYPSSWWFFYDPVRTKMPKVKVVYFPTRYQNVRAEPREEPSEVIERARDLQWIAKTGVEVVLLPDWVELAVQRERPHGYAGGFYRRLGDGTLGFHLAAYFRTHYLTEALYVWGDPMLRTHWETGISGYKLFVRDGSSRGRGRKAVEPLLRRFP